MDNKIPEDSNTGTKDVEQVTDERRRQLAKAALAAPIITSLISRPVWGAGAACSLSGMQSGNASGNDHSECTGSGCTPGYWKDNLGSWLLNTPYSPGYCITFDNTNNEKAITCKEWNFGTGTTFLDAFGVSSYSDTDLVNNTLLQILKFAEYDGATISLGNIHAIEAHFVAALLNSAAQPEIYGATQADIIYAVVDAYSNGDEAIETLFDTLVKMNEAGSETSHCIFNSKGFCDDDNEVSNGEECIIACDGNELYDYCKKACVLKGDIEFSLKDALAHPDPDSYCLYCVNPDIKNPPPEGFSCDIISDD